MSDTWNTLLQGGGDHQHQPPPGTMLNHQDNPLKEMFRAGYDFYTQNSPRTWSGLVYGQTEDNEPDVTYWVTAAKLAGEIGKRYDNHPFMLALLADLYAEMESEYKAEKEKARRK